MTPRQIMLVQESWKELEPMVHAAAALLYNRLFALDPKLPLLFPGDIQEQGRKLMSTIGVAVDSLSRPAPYPLIEEALVWTLGQRLGAAFTREVEQAWRAASGVLAATMKRSAA